MSQKLKDRESVSDTAEFISGQIDLKSIDQIRAQFERRYASCLSTNLLLTRGLVSFQANKSRAVYRWYKFKEAFSAGIVEYLLERSGIENGVVLDPFAGSGTTLFASSGLGLTAEGIELLPIGQRIVETKQLIDSALKPVHIAALTTVPLNFQGN